MNSPLVQTKTLVARASSQCEWLSRSTDPNRVFMQVEGGGGDLVSDPEKKNHLNPGHPF